jgi:hypothetical protein
MTDAVSLCTAKTGAKNVRQTQGRPPEGRGAWLPPLQEVSEEILREKSRPILLESSITNDMRFFKG